MLVKRKPRKLMRVMAAAEILNVSRQKVKSLIAEGRLTPAPVERCGPTSPIKLYEAQVAELAKQWGIL